MGALGVACFVFGVAMVAAFFLYQRPHSTPLVPTGPVGHYFVAFTGCGLIAWAGGLVGAARAPLASRSIGTMTIVVLILMAVIRMVAWMIGDYFVWLGDLPRTEAAGLLIVAGALIWLKPTVEESMVLAARGAPAEVTGSDSGSTPERSSA